MREKVDVNAAKLIELIGTKIMFGVVVAIAALLSWNTPVQADAPAAPTDLSARNWWGIVERNSDEGITLSWTAPEGTVTGYRILRQRSGCDDALVVHVEDTESDATTYTDRDVVGGVTYEYRVKAINSDDVGPQSDAVTFEYGGNFLAELGDDSGPDRPTGLEVWNLTSGIQLKWRAPDGTLTGYQILRRSPGNCEAFQVHAENTGSTSAFWDDPDVEVETPYEYRVVAINRFGRGGQSTSAEITRSTTTGIRVIYSPEERYTLQRRTNWIQMGVNHRLALDDDPETIDYTFRGDVTLSSDGSDVDSCEGTGLGEGREIRQVSRRSQTFDFTFGGAGCRIGTYSITHVFYDSEDNELFSVIRSEEVIGVAINGRAQVGETLSTDVSTISDTDDFAGTTFKYKWWTSDDSVIQGATSSTYTVVASNVGKAIWAEVEVTDIYDRRYVIQSLRTAAVVQANSAATGAPTNGGTAQVGQTLNVDTSSIADEDGLDNVSYSYQWLADDANISGATGPTYTLVAADVRKAIKSRVSFTDDAGNQESITSDPTEEVPGIWGGTVTVGSDPAGSGAVGYSAFAIGMGSITAPDFVADGEGYTVDVVAYSHQGLHLALSRELSTPFTLHLDAKTFESSSASTSVGAEAYIYTWDHPVLNWTEGDSVSVIIMEGETASPQGTSTNSPATGTPTISGSVQVGQTLTVDTSNVADQDGSDNATFAYQWARIDGTTDTDIQGGTGSTYTLTSDDEGKTVKVRVTFTDDAGNSESLTSAATAAVSPQPILIPQNSPAAGEPAICDRTQEVQDAILDKLTDVSDCAQVTDSHLAGITRLTVRFTSSQAIESNDLAGLSALTDLELISDQISALPEDVFGGLGSLEKLLINISQLQSLPEDVFEGLGSLRGLTVGERGFRVTGEEVFAHQLNALPKDVFDGLDSLEELYLGHNQLTVLPEDVFDGLDSLEALNLVGNQLSALPEDVYDGLESLEGLNLHANNLGALPEDVFDGLDSLKILTLDNNQLTTLPEDVFDGLGNLDGLSFSTNQITTLPEDLFDGLDSLYFLSFSTNRIATLPENIFDGLGNLQGLLLANNQIRELPSKTFDGLSQLIRLHLSNNPGAPFTVKAELEQDGDDAVVVKVAEGAPSNIAVTLSAAGGTLSTTTVTVEGGSVSSESVTVTPTSGGTQVTVSLESAVFRSIPAPEIFGIRTGVGASLTMNSLVTGAPTISGTAQVSETLAAVTSGISDDDGLSNVYYAFQWLADDSDIGGATGSSYTLVEADEGRAIRVRVSFTDDRGNAETLTSAATAAVAERPNNAATGEPAISGTAQVSETLAAVTSGISDDDGLSNVYYAFQWLADDSDIGGATGGSYTLVEADEGRAIRVRLSFTDDRGNAETLTSAATAAVEEGEMIPLTATIPDAPSSHDGSNTFTFELRFSEEFPLSYETLRDHAFTVTGGDVVHVRRLEKGKNVRWEISIRPDGNGAVTILLPATTDCEADGAVCTDGGRKLSQELEFEVPGPSTPEISLSTPEITSGSSFSVDEGATEVATLRATDGDTPAANLTWSVSGGDDEAKFAVTAAGALSFAAAKDYETPDDAGADGVYEVTVQVSDGGRTDSADLTVMLTNVNEAPTADAGSDQADVEQGAAVTLSGSGADPDSGDTLSHAWTQSGTPAVTLSDSAVASPTFTAPTGLSADTALTFTLRVTDARGLYAEDSVTVAISGQLPLTPLTASARDLPASHDGNSAFTFELRFSETPRKGFSYRTLRDNALTVTGGEVVKVRRLEKGKNVRWEISVTPRRKRPGDHRAARHHGLHGAGRHLHPGPQAALQQVGVDCPRTVADGAGGGTVGPCELTGFRDFYKYLQESEEGDPDLARLLRPFATGSLRHLLSDEGDDLLGNEALVTVFDLRLSEPELRPAAAMVCTETVWAAAAQDPKPRLLVVDEVWSIMQHPEGAAFMVSVAKRARKHRLGLQFITQDVQDLLSEDSSRTITGHSGRALLQNAAFKLLLQQDAAAISTVGDAFDLPEELQRWLLSCPRGDGLLLAKGNRFPVRIEATPEETAVIEWRPGRH